MFSSFINKLDVLCNFNLSYHKLTIIFLLSKKKIQVIIANLIFINF